MRHQAKSFTIELKRGRRIGGPSPASYADTGPRASSKGDTHAKSPELVGNRWWVDHIANPAGAAEPRRPDFPVSAAQSELPSTIAPRPPGRRILPDLTSQDWLLQIAPEQASAGSAKRPTGSGTAADGVQPPAGRGKHRRAPPENPLCRLRDHKRALEQRNKQKPLTASDTASIGGEAGWFKGLRRPPTRCLLAESSELFARISPFESCAQGRNGNDACPPCAGEDQPAPSGTAIRPKGRLTLRVRSR